MLCNSHPKYNDAMRRAVIVAAKFEIGNRAGARVYYNPLNDEIGVINRHHKDFYNGDLRTIAYVQRWDKTTVEIRETGAASTFVKV